MCIAIYKPVGQSIPPKRIFSNSFSNNDDGAGFMFPVNGKVHIEKGFMTFTAFKKALKAAVKAYGISPIDTPMVFHFRIQTQGGVRADLTHPFPVTRDYDEMRKLICDADFGVVHNGIIDFASHYLQNVDYSDTMEFTKEIVCPLVGKNANYYKNKAVMRMLNYLIGSSRFLIMSGDGHVELLGTWKEDNGIYYSNSTYSYKSSGYSYTKSSSTGSSSKYYKQSTLPLSNIYPTISKETEKKFLQTGILECEECAGEMYVYKSYSGNYYASCLECGEIYRLTDKAIEYAKSHMMVSYYEDDYEDDYYYNSFYGKKSYGGAK